MPGLRLRQFNGIRPRLAPKLLDEQTGQTASNVSLIAGRLECLKEPKSTQAITANQISLYRWYRNSTNEWLTWPVDVDVVRGPIANDTYERIYYTGDGTGGSINLKVTGWDASKKTRNVGLSAPSAPTIAAAAQMFTVPDITIKARTTNTCSWGNNSDSGSEEDGVLESYSHGEDGLITATFAFAAKRFAAITSTVAHYNTWSANSVVWPQLTIPDGAVPEVEHDVPAAFGGDPKSVTVDLFSGGTKYATLAVKSWTVSGRTTDWNYIDHPSGSPYNTITPTNSQYKITFIFEMSYLTIGSEYRYYVQTFVSDWGAEGPASDLSSIISIKPGQNITVTLPGATPGGENITKRRIYRSAAGTTDDNFYFVAEVTEATGSYADVLTDAELGEVMPVLTNPVTGMTGLIAMPGGWLAAFKDKTLYCSEPFLPYSWPEEYQLTFEYDIVALAPSGNDIIVMTTGNPYIVTGSHPELLTQTRLMLNQSCVSKRGVCQVGRFVAYPSPDGIVIVSSGRAEIATHPFYSKEDWNALTPSSMIAAVYDNRYHGWMTGGAIIFDFQEKQAALTTTSVTVKGVYADLQSDSLFLIGTGDTFIYEWNAGTNNLLMTWKSKEFTLPRPFAPRICRILSDTYPADASTKELTIMLYSDGVLATTKEVFSGAAVMLPKLRPSRVWAFTVTSYNSIDEIALVTVMEELR